MISVAVIGDVDNETNVLLERLTVTLSSADKQLDKVTSVSS